VDVGGITEDSRTLAGEILDAAGVAVTPGLDFDPARGHRWLRLSYAAATADIEEGLDRIGAFFARRA
jgi:aspartate/methionine/tyrosine aminotransferase